jgi:hypothetical protein
MARWLALVSLPEFATRDQAERYARIEFSRSLIRVESVASWEVAEEERQVALRTLRRRAPRDPGPVEDGA